VYSSPRRQYKGRTAGAIFRLEICHARLCDRLFVLGLTPRKSLTMQFPQVPRDCIRHFVRGCWDGDGSVLRTTDGRRLIAKFGCGSSAFVEGMLEALYAEGFPWRRVHQLRRRGVAVNYPTRKYQAFADYLGLSGEF